MLNRHVIITIIVFFVILINPLISIARYNYNLEYEGENIVIIFEEKEYIRQHTGPQYVPYSERWVYPNVRIIIKPGQWLEVRLDDGDWARMTEADNR